MATDAFLTIFGYLLLQHRYKALLNDLRAYIDRIYDSMKYLAI